MSKSPAAATSRSLRRSLGRDCSTVMLMPNAQVQLQAQYNQSGEAASMTCLSAATHVRPLAGRRADPAALEAVNEVLQVLGSHPHRSHQTAAPHARAEIRR